MATPLYDALRAKVINWSNRDPEVLAPTTAEQNTLVGDFLSYAADECYRKLRIPPFELDTTYTIETADIIGSPNISVLNTNNWAGNGGQAYNKILLPVDFVEMVYIRYAGVANAVTSTGMLVNPGIVFNERTDERTFFDFYAETYSNFYWMRSGDYIYIKPALPVGTQLAFHYYRQLPALDALYSVVPENFLFTVNTDSVPIPASAQPFLGDPTGTETGKTLYGINLQKSGGLSLPAAYYSTASARDTAYATYIIPSGYTKSTSQQNFIGKEVPNWLRDQNERLLIWGALARFGAFLDDDKLQLRYEKMFLEDIQSLNSEEKYRRAKGGNVQVHFNANGLI